MNEEDFQRAWRAQSGSNPARVMDTLALLKSVRAKQQAFRRAIFWRDVREVGVAALLVPFFIHGGWKTHWTLYLCAFGCLVVGGFILLDRYHQRKRRPERQDSLLECTLSSLNEVSHQIWLLENVLWWYLLPLGVPLLIFFSATSLSSSQPVPAQLSGLLGKIGLVGLVYGGIYALNRWAVKWDLAPRRRELESLMLDLQTETLPLTMKAKKPLWPLTLVLLACLISFLNVFENLKAQDTGVRPSGPFTDLDSQMLETVRLKHQLPALATLVIIDGKMVATNAVGFRKHGTADVVTVHDRFHLGSVTKSMTATLAAILVEQGKISWTTTIGESFPELGAQLHKDYREVTLEQLLAHRGGAPENAPKDLWAAAWKAEGPPSEGRLAFVKGLLARKPETKPGTKMVYSNQGYAIAGVMLEKATDSTWEELMRTRLFEPLGMHSAGFGAPGTPGQVDQPWGHTKRRVGGFRSVPPGPGADNPPAIGPAGTVHCSLSDLAVYVQHHLMGEKGESTLLRADSFRKLHTAVGGGDYALGWVVLERPWSGGRALMHNGSNTMFYIVIWMAPEKNSAVIAATNIGDPRAPFAGCDEAVSQLIRKYFP